MEDASGVDLDWFWHGWFYTTDHTDISIENVRLFQVDTQNPEVEKNLQRRQADAAPVTLSQRRNESIPKRIDQYPSLRDYYNDFDKFKVTDQEREEYQTFLSGLNEAEKSTINSGSYFYVVDLKNVGGLVMPVIFKVEYVDGTTEEIRIPAEIWRYNNFEVSKLIVSKKEVKAIVLDPNLETADTDLTNNFFPRRAVPTRFQSFKSAQSGNTQPEPTTPRAPTPPTVNQNAGLSGRWNILIDSGGGLTIPFAFDLKQTGNAVTGTIESPQGTFAIRTGTFQNGLLTLKTSSAIGFIFVGRIIGDKISGTATAPQGESTFSGSKSN